MTTSTATRPTSVVDLHGWTAARMAAEGVVYVGRSMSRDRRPAVRAGSPFGNPFRSPRDGTGVEVLLKYRAHLLARPDLLALLPSLKGKVLGCWCCTWSGIGESLDLCHAEVLAILADDGVPA